MRCANHILFSTDPILMGRSRPGLEASARRELPKMCDRFRSDRSMEQESFIHNISPICSGVQEG